MRYCDTYESPYGPMLLVATNNGICGVYFKGQKYFPEQHGDRQRVPGHAILKQAKQELAEYFTGKRRRFEVVLDPDGTAFQRSVWNAISRVGFVSRSG